MFFMILKAIQRLFFFCKIQEKYVPFLKTNFANLNCEAGDVKKKQATGNSPFRWKQSSNPDYSVSTFMCCYCLEMVRVTQEISPSKYYLLQNQEQVTGNCWRIYYLQATLSASRTWSRAHWSPWKDYRNFYEKRNVLKNSMDVRFYIVWFHYLLILVALIYFTAKIKMVKEVTVLMLHLR